MGYYTRFEMEYQLVPNEVALKPKNLSIETLDHDIAVEINKYLGLYSEEEIANNPDFCVDELFYDEHKWYDCELEMRAISKVFPYVIFTLHGQGEDYEDIWTMKAFDGYTRREWIEISYPYIDDDDIYYAAERFHKAELEKEEESKD